MTRIDFYTHVQDRELVVCQICAKALAHGQRVHIFTEPGVGVQRLLDRLWSFHPLAFVPACRANDPLAGRTPVVVDDLGQYFTHEQILLNLHPQWPPFFSRFERLIEIISIDPAVAGPARERFRYYREHGYPIQSHNLSQESTDDATPARQQ